MSTRFNTTIKLIVFTILIFITILVHWTSGQEFNETRESTDGNNSNKFEKTIRHKRTGNLCALDSKGIDCNRTGRPVVTRPNHRVHRQRTGIRRQNMCVNCNLSHNHNQVFQHPITYIQPLPEHKRCLKRTARRLCAHRDYGNGATVCVCNQTYCDDLRPITQTLAGVIKVYETSKSGDRFAESTLQFRTNPTDEDELSNSFAKYQSISINRSQTYQKIIGFGGAFTDSAGINLAALPKALQLKAISDYYSENGIEYNLGRIPIGGSDFSTRSYTYDDIEGDFNLKYFTLAPEDLNYKIPYLKMAQELSPGKIKFFGSPWSSPAWMKTNKKLTNGGFLIGEPGNKYYQTFANYFVKFLDEYRKRNITLWGITVENEPMAGFDRNYKWNSLGFSSELQRDFIKTDLGPTLAKAGYGANRLKLMINDDQRPTVSEWAQVILGDDEAAQYVAGSAFHWYHNTLENIEELDKAHNAFPEYFLLATEACEEWKNRSEKVSLGNWNTFNRYAFDIITNLNHWTSGWTDWNLALDMKGGPNWVKNFVDAPIIINAAVKEYYKQPFFYALGHFSKFLSSDSVRIGLNTEPESIDKVEVTAFRRPDNSTVLIVLNMNTEFVSLTINDDNFGFINNIIKPNSLQTYIWFD